MDWRYKFTGLLLLLFLTSCSVIPSGTQPTLGPIFPTMVSTGLPYPDPETPFPPVTPSPEPPTSTSQPSETKTTDEPTQTPSLTPTIPAPQGLLDVQIGSPLGMPNFTHPEMGCQWMGVAGQVFDADGKPMQELVVEFGGTLAGQDVFGLTVLGQAEAYGSGGYEFKLSDQPIASSETVWARVYDLDGIPLSKDTYFSTYGECEKNLVLLNFVQISKLPTDWVYLPLINNEK